MVLPVLTASQANQVFLETTHQFPWTKKANAAGAHLDHPDLLAHQDQRDQLVSKATQAPLANLARMDLKDHPVHPAQLARKAKMPRTARRESPERMPNEATKDHQARPAKLENPEQRATMETKDPVARLAERATTDHPDHQAKVASQETRDPLVLPDPKANLVQMLTTAPARNALPRLPPRLPRKHKKGEDRSDTRCSPKSGSKITVNLNSAFLGDNRKSSHPVLRILNLTTSGFGVTIPWLWFLCKSKRDF